MFRHLPHFSVFTVQQGSWEFELGHRSDDRGLTREGRVPWRTDIQYGTHSEELWGQNHTAASLPGPAVDRNFIGPGHHLGTRRDVGGSHGRKQIELSIDIPSRASKSNESTLIPSTLQRCVGEPIPGCSYSRFAISTCCLERIQPSSRTRS